MDKIKLEEVKEIYKSWLGGFISGENAMINIGKTLDIKVINNISITDQKGEVVLEADEGYIK